MADSRMMLGANAKRSIFYGWWVLAALFFVAFLGPSARTMLSALFPFLLNDMGWTRAEIGTAFTIHFWLYGLAAPFIGRMVDILGGRRTIFIGGVILLAGLVLLSTLRSLLQFYLSYGVLLAIGVGMTHMIPNTATTRKWFIRRAGLATALVLVGLTLGTAVMSPLATYLSSASGWRMAALINGLGIGIIIMLLALLVIRSNPESMKLHPDGVATVGEKASTQASHKSAVASEAAWTPKQALTTVSFWALFIAYALSGIPFNGLTGHAVMWGIDLGMGQANAGIVMTALSLPGIPLRIFGSWLSDKYGKKIMMIIAYGLSTIIFILGWLTVTSTQSLILFAVFTGAIYSLPFALFTPYLGDLFGRASVGTLLGMLTVGFALIGGLGPLAWGWISDVTGSYNLACLLSAACYAVAAVAMVVTKVEKKRAPTAIAA